MLCVESEIDSDVSGRCRMNGSTDAIFMGTLLLFLGGSGSAKRADGKIKNFLFYFLAYR
jgi:hypothetical protein